MRLGLCLSFLALTSCQLLPTVQLPIKDLSGIKTYNILVECNHQSLPITSCVGGVHQGQFYCENVMNYDCKPGEKILFTAFDANSFPALESYIKYVAERFDQCATF